MNLFKKVSSFLVLFTVIFTLLVGISAYKKVNSKNQRPYYFYTEIWNMSLIDRVSKKPMKFNFTGDTDFSKNVILGVIVTNIETGEIVELEGSFDSDDWLQFGITER